MADSDSGKIVVKLDCVSDFVCSWCYIGHLELERGMALAKERGLPITFQVKYHPFMLNASLTDDVPVSKRDYFARKFGSDADSKLDMCQARAKEEGIELTFEGVVRQTTRAHRLLQKAYALGGQVAQRALLRRLFRAFFERGQDIGDSLTLAHLASTARDPAFGKLLESDPILAPGGSDADDGAAAIFSSEEEAFEWLQGNEMEKEVKVMSAEAARKGVKGVPFTVIDGRWAVSGCQQPECYYKIFEKLASAEVLSCLASKSEGFQKIGGSGTTCALAT